MKSFTSFALVTVCVCTACADPDDAVAPKASPLRPHTSYAAATDGDTVMRHLVSPRGLAFGPDSGLYVAEAGLGGTKPCFTTGKDTYCYGPSGAVSRLLDGVQTRVAEGLASYAHTNSGRGAGPSGISFQGMGKAFVTVGLEDSPLLRERTDLKPYFDGFGRLVQLKPSALASGHVPHSGNTWEYVADLGTYEKNVNPDCGDLDSNPFGIMADGGGVIIADAGANSFIRREANGDLSTFATFSNNTGSGAEGCPKNTGRDFVPTTITMGPDGAYYMGHLNGFPLVVNGSSVYRMERGGTPQEYLKNFTFIIGIAFDANGNLYVLQHTTGVPNAAAPGSLIRVAPDGTRETVVTGIQKPGGFAIGPDGNIYISTIPGKNYRDEGLVLRFTP